MKVKCVLCDSINTIDSYCLQAKRLRNRRITTYMCPDCHERIKKNTEKRVNSGHFTFNRERKREKHLP
ncbi:YlaI family protein [Halobacillus sp. A1]|uniref:YlaI family protein n=1 Tax=Halobacillus campisalis TaxID=435909 RepID=A0ABW2K5I5_9BACI|nr:MULTISPECIES: YlaI family protein [Halobacillus]MCP3031059.1 YlaI family protein [Halobacillus sp. A1]